MKDLRFQMLFIFVCYFTPPYNDSLGPLQTEKRTTFLLKISENLR